MTYDALRTDGSDGRLVLTFHGPGADEEQFHGAARAFLPDAHVVSPRGDVLATGTRRFLDHAVGTACDLDDLDRRAEAMVEFVAAEIARTGARDVVGLGFSDGAGLLVAAALRAPSLIRTLVLLHPVVPWTPEPEPGLAMVRMLITAGRQDPVCPPERTQALVDYFSAQKVDVILAWHPGGHEIPQSEVEAISQFLT